MVPPVKVYFMASYVGIIRIRSRVEVVYFLSACQHKLPCILFTPTLYAYSTEKANQLEAFVVFYIDCFKTHWFPYCKSIREIEPSSPLMLSARSLSVSVSSR